MKITLESPRVPLLLIHLLSVRVCQFWNRCYMQNVEFLETTSLNSSLVMILKILAFNRENNVYVFIITSVSMSELRKPTEYWLSSQNWWCPLRHAVSHGGRHLRRRLGHPHPLHRRAPRQAAAAARAPGVRPHRLHDDGLRWAEHRENKIIYRKSFKQSPLDISIS